MAILRALRCRLGAVCLALVPQAALALEPCLPIREYDAGNWHAYWTGWAPDDPAPVCTDTPGNMECVWTYPLVAPDALTLYADLRHLTVTCLGADALLWEDTGVNHPDLFKSLGLGAGDLTVSVSLKRKSPLRQTRVVFRVAVAG